MCANKTVNRASQNELAASPSAERGIAGFNEIVTEHLAQVPRLLLERHISEKLRLAGVRSYVTKAKEVALRILSGDRGPVQIEQEDLGDVLIEITEADLESVLERAEHFMNHKLDDVLLKTATYAAMRIHKTLERRWSGEFMAQQDEMAQFKARLDQRWGRALAKLRMLVTIVREWAGGAYELRWNLDKTISRYDDLIFRLHARACQVMHEIIILLENGLADGAMARWRTLHEIEVVAAVIARFGDEIAARYEQYEIVESYKALQAFERDHKALGYKPLSMRAAARVRNRYARAIKRFGKSFGEEYGWAAHHLKVRGHLTFARLELEAGKEFMRSPYKMASYNVHASPKGVYFRLGVLGDGRTMMSGVSNAGLTDPGQYAAASLVNTTLILMGETNRFEDMIVLNIFARLTDHARRELAKAEGKLRRDDKKFRAAERA
jgi:hypothetical protein